jgi:hypothetical protein
MRMFKIIIAGLFTFLLTNYIAPEIIYLSLLIKLAGVLFFGFLLYSIGFFSKKELKFIKNKIDLITKKYE